MFTSLTLAAMLAGYVVGLLAIPGLVSQSRYLTISAVMGVVFCLGAWATHGYVSVAFVALLGFANAMMWPAIFPLAIRGLGRFTETGSALLVMGTPAARSFRSCSPCSSSTSTSSWCSCC